MIAVVVYMVHVVLKDATDVKNLISRGLRQIVGKK